MLSLYLHIPFCVNKCLYCGFYSTGYRADLADEFLSGLRCEADRYRSAFRERPFSTVYIGGGTPTCLAHNQVEMFFAILSESFQRTPDAEFTVEMNPGTVSDSVLVLLRQRGVNRLSIGVQSFSDAMLGTLGRIHTAGGAAGAVVRARHAGFRNIGIDLMYGIPGQNAVLWQETLEQTVVLGPEHVSTYCLSFDEGSAFTRMAGEGTVRPPDDESAAPMYEQAVEVLTGAGYGQYELSNFARPGFECMHNKNYWNRGEYLGLGPAAWSFLAGRRHGNIADVREYSRRLHAGLPAIDQEDAPAADEAARESLFLGLRTAAGVDLRQFQMFYGRKAYDRLMKNLNGPQSAGLVQIAEGHVRLTGPGRLLADEAILKLCP